MKHNCASLYIYRWQLADLSVPAHIFMHSENKLCPVNVWSYSRYCSEWKWHPLSCWVCAFWLSFTSPYLSLHMTLPTLKQAAMDHLSSWWRQILSWRTLWHSYRKMLLSWRPEVVRKTWTVTSGASDTLPRTSFCLFGFFEVCGQQSRLWVCFYPVRDNYNLKAHKYMCMTTNQPDTKSNPNPNPNLDFYY